MFRFFTLAAGLALFGLTVAASIQFQIPRIEADLVSRARAAAQKADFGWLELGATGQTVMLAGNAPDYITRNNAEALIAAVWGVAAVDNQIKLVGEGESCSEELAAFEVAEPVQFASGSTTIDPDAERILIRLAAIARNCDAQVVVTLAARPGVASKNARLDRARLDVVHRFLVRSGVPTSLVIGGSASPERVDRSKRHERRVEIWVVEETA